MSSQDTGRTIAKKRANVTVGNSTAGPSSASQPEQQLSHGGLPAAVLDPDDEREGAGGVDAARRPGEHTVRAQVKARREPPGQRPGVRRLATDGADARRVRPTTLAGGKLGGRVQCAVELRREHVLKP